MIEDDNILESLIANTLNSESKTIDSTKLETFLFGLVDELKKNGCLLESDSMKLLGIVCKLWREKEYWKNMFYEMAERYNKHLDKELAEYKRILGYHSRQVPNNDKE